MAATEPLETRHRIKVRVLVILASIFAFLAIFTSWVDQQVLDTNQWTDTSGRLLQDQEISNALAGYSVDQLYASVNVAAVLKKQLPSELKPISAPAAAGARDLATRAAEQAFQTSQVQNLWVEANRVAHDQLVAILKGDNQAIRSENGKVVLDLRPIILQLAGQIGLKKQAHEAIKKGESTGTLQANFGRLQIADAQQLHNARTITRIVQGLAWVFMLGTLALFALAIWLAKGRRWVVVLGYGLGLIVAGLVAIAVRSAAKGPVVDTLATSGNARVPAQHAWEIATSLLHSIATSVVIFGVLFVVASFLASPAGAAVSIRRAAAPTLRDRPGIVWSVFAAIALAVLITWPPPGTRQLVLTLLLIALAAAGLEALSRKTRYEFPGAKQGEWMQSMRARARRSTKETSRRLGSAVRELTDDDAASPDEQTNPDDVKLERLEKLAELKEKGVLTAREFRQEKKRILSG
jgi:hypothetical protein